MEAPGKSYIKAYSLKCVRIHAAAVERVFILLQMRWKKMSKKS